jgi:hypothetical protein
MLRAILIALALCAVGCSNGNNMACDGGTMTLTISAPDCLQAPNHDMVLFEIGKDVNVAVNGGCAQPTLSVASVTSNQPPLGGGQGNFSPDVIYGTNNVCLRSERQGGASDNRIYTITVLASDGSNSITQSVNVRVQHDSSGGACAPVDPSRIVSADDPRCSQ